MLELWWQPILWRERRHLINATSSEIDALLCAAHGEAESPDARPRGAACLDLAGSAQRGRPDADEAIDGIAPRRPGRPYERAGVSSKNVRLDFIAMMRRASYCATRESITPAPTVRTVGSTKGEARISRNVARSIGARQSAAE